MKNNNSTMDFWSAIRDSRALHEGGMLPKPGETTEPSAETPVETPQPVAPQPAVTETVRRWSVSDGAPSYADAVEEWKRQGKPVLTELAKYFPAPTPEMTEEQARRKRAAGALGDSLKLLGEIYGDSQNATIRNRYGEPSGMAQANAEVEKATARYQQLLNAHNRVMGSAAMDEINRIYGSMGQQYGYEMQRRADAARAQAQRELARQKAQEERDNLRFKFENYDKPKQDLSHAQAMELEKERTKGRLAEIRNRGAQDRLTKRTAPAKTGGSGRMVDGKYPMRLESTAWDDSLAKEQDNLRVKTRDFHLKPQEYEAIRNAAREALLETDESALDEYQRKFRKTYQGSLPAKGAADWDYYADRYAQLLYDNQQLGYTDPIENFANSK